MKTLGALACSPIQNSSLGVLDIVVSYLANFIYYPLKENFYLAKKIGFRSEACLANKTNFNLPAFLSWVVTLIFCLGLNQIYGVEIFFLGLPGWFLAVLIFITLSKIYYPIKNPSSS